MKIPAVLERVSDILSAFTEPPSRLPITAIAQRAGLPKSTAHRIVNHLLELGWLRRAAGGYVLGDRFSPVDSDGGHLHLRSAASPVLHALQRQAGTVVHLGVQQGDHVLVLDKLGGSELASVLTNVGDLLPLHGTAVGKAILSTMSPEVVDDLLPQHLECRTPRTIATMEMLHAELARARARRGVAYDRNEYAGNIACVGVPIPQSAAAPSALSITSNAPLEVLIRMTPLLRDCARRIAVRLGQRTALGHDAVAGAITPDLTMLRMLNTLNIDDWL